MTSRSSAKLSTVEFIILMGLMTSIGALTTDIMLPALGEIGRALSVSHANDVQLIVITFFIGMATGQLFVGPLADCFGRRPVIFAGYGLFALGCLLTMFTDSWALMLLGRALQGIGAAGPRVVAMAVVRDLYSGRTMARIMSFMMAVFLTLPLIAPALGQGIIALSGWRIIFWFLLIKAFVVALWFWRRQPETLKTLTPFSITTIARGLREIISNRTAFGYTLVLGVSGGPFIAYLSSAQQIFDETFGLAVWFPLLFALGTLPHIIAALSNAQLVERFGMRALTNWSAWGMTIVSLGFSVLFIFWGFKPPLLLFMAWMFVAFFSLGMMWGNLNALAMEPLGHIAGLGAAFISALSMFMSLPFGWALGAAFSGTVAPVVIGFALAGAASLLTIWWVEKGAIATSS